MLCMVCISTSAHETSVLRRAAEHAGGWSHTAAVWRARLLLLLSMLSLISGTGGCPLAAASHAAACACAVVAPLWLVMHSLTL